MNWPNLCNIQDKDPISPVFFCFFFFPLHRVEYHPATHRIKKATWLFSTFCLSVNKCYKILNKHSIYEYFPTLLVPTYVMVHYVLTSNSAVLCDLIFLTALFLILVMVLLS